MGPMEGPRNGAAAKTAVARPRSWAENISAMTPPELVRGLEPKAPAKKRSTIKVWMSWAAAAPALKAVRAA